MTEMLELVEQRGEKISAQEQLVRVMQNVWGNKEIRRIVWRPDAIDLEVSHDSDLWFASSKTGKKGAVRYWNSFGIFTRSGNLNIAVEINIPIDKSDGRVSGFVARDKESGARYLMHDGGLGGGRKGIGRAAFLAWSGLKPVPVADSSGQTRFGLIVASLDGTDVDATVSSFVNRAIAFKAAATSGSIEGDPASKLRENALNDYFKEFAGRKSGMRRRELNYISRHGDVVDAVSKWARENVIGGGRIVKNIYIDLGVESGGELTALFEIKTNLDRQCLYTAIGQLEVHSGSVGALARYLVLPSDGNVAADIQRCLARNAIRVLRYELRGRSVRLELE